MSFSGHRHPNRLDQRVDKGHDGVGIAWNSAEQTFHWCFKCSNGEAKNHCETCRKLARTDGNCSQIFFIQKICLCLILYQIRYNNS